MYQKKRLWVGVLFACLAGSAAYPSSTGPAAARRDLCSLYSHYLKGYLLQKYSVRGDKEANAQRLRAALREYNLALSSFEGSSRIQMNRGAIYLGLNNFPKAEESLKKSLELDQDNIGASFILAFLYAQLKDEQKMNSVYEHFLKQAQRLQPENLQISEYLGQFYLEKGNSEEAVKVYKILVEAHPDYANGYFWLGYLSEGQGKRDEAIAYWKKTLELEPQHADALNSLGYVYAEQGTRLNEALLLIRKALELRPEEGAYMDSLGWIYFKQGEFSRAELYLKKASEQLKDPVIFYHLGEVYRARQHLQDACVWWKKSREIQKDRNPASERITHECK